MGLYDAAKDALKVAQSIDNVELVQKLLDVQKQALDMQEKQQHQHQKIVKLENELEKTRENKRYIFEEGKNWYIDPEKPDRKLCPVCTNKLMNPVPLKNKYCYQCKASY